VVADRWPRIVRQRFRSLFQRDRAEDELEKEMEFHLEERTREFIAAGMSPGDARDAALRAFGGVEQRKEECRDARRVRPLEDLLHDLRYGVRMMRRSPGFTAVAACSLGLGIGAPTAIFTLFDALLLKPLPVERYDELRVAKFVWRAGGGRQLKVNQVLPYDWFRQLRSAPEVFDDVIAFEQLVDPDIRIAGREVGTSGGGLFVSDNYFALLGVAPQVGRMFPPGSRPIADEHTTVVLGDRFWRRAFGADPQTVGQTITINGVPFTVIGVAPSGFFGLTRGQSPDVFLPVEAMAVAQPAMLPLADRSAWKVQIVGRLKTGLADVPAADRLTAMRRNVDPVAAQQSIFVEVLPLDVGLSDLRARFLRPFAVLMVFVGVLLLIACANVSTMLLSRAAARKAEIAVRVAIGAGRGRLIRQLTTESMLLALMGGVIGILFASWLTAGMLTILPPDTMRGIAVVPDGRVLAFTLGVSLAAALLCGVAPAFLARRIDVSTSLRESRRTGGVSGGRVARPFVVAQVALALTLVVAAGLLARTLYGLTTIDPGFDIDGVILADVDPGAREYRDARLGIYYRELLHRVRATPAVVSATLVQMSFLSGGRTTGTVDVPGFTPVTEADRWVQIYLVGPDFFRTSGIAIVEGRDFTDQDLAPGPAMAAINETAALRYFKGQSPIGRSIGSYGIIAVVRDARYNTLRDESVAALFVPYMSYGLRPRMTLAVRARDGKAAFQAVMSQLRAIDPAVPVRIRTLESLMKRSLAQERLLAVIVTFFALAALVLVALGLYGVMAFWVHERTSEIGVRLALGARRSQVLWSVLQRPLRFVIAGSAVGLLIVIAASEFVRGFLFGVTPLDPATIAGAMVLMIGVAALAGLLPARRAARIDPLVALRAE